MAIWCWILIGHTVVWAVSSALVNFFSSELWDETSFWDKVVGYFVAERQLYRGIKVLILYRKKLFPNIYKNSQDEDEYDD